MTEPTNNISRKFLRIRLHNSEVYSFVKQITTIICSVYNIPLIAMYAGSDELRFYGVSVNKEAFQNTFRIPSPEDYQFFPPILKSRDNLSFKTHKVREHSFSFSGLEIVFLYLSDQNQISAFTDTFKEIEDQVAMLLLPMIQDEEWVNSSRLKESLRIANQYVQSFPFLHSLLQLVLHIIQKYSKADYLSIQYKTETQKDFTTIVVGKREEKKYNTHTYSSTEYGFVVQITVRSTLPFPNSPVEMYRMNRTARLTNRLVSLYFSQTEDYYLLSHITFTKIYHTLLGPSPDQLDQMLDIGRSFAKTLKLSVPESYVLQWLIVLDNVGEIAIELFTRSGNQPWEIDFSSVVKKTIIENLSIPIQYPSISSIDKNLFRAILTCVRVYPLYIQKKNFHTRKEMIEEICKLDVPENFLPIFIKLIDKTLSLTCFEITHCSKELRELCPLYKQIQKDHAASPCYGKE
ncbi:MAG: hypothetical protein PHI40_08125, partial [Caldisericia bacterium]|nr:hypothetical protein [Caldisericia bacterium]